jgi:hypothetical protein
MKLKRVGFRATERAKIEEDGNPFLPVYGGSAHLLNKPFGVWIIDSIIGHFEFNGEIVYLPA